MTYFSKTCLVTVGLLSATPLWAQATPEGADELLALFQTYLGATPGVVSVSVDGDAYAVTLDVSPMMAAIPVEGLTATVSPVMMTVGDNGDGTWFYEIDQPFSMSYAIDGQMSASTDYASVVVSGTFDEALGDTSAYQVELTGLKSTQTQTDPTMGEVTIANSVDSLNWSGSATAGAAGVDGVFNVTTSGIAYDMMIPTGEGAPPMQITGTVANATAEGSMTGYQPAGIYGLLAWFVAHPDQAMIEADKAGLKAAIESALPIFANLAVTGAYNDIVVNSPVGAFGLTEAGIEVEMNGAVSDGLFREAISLKGLTMPEGLLPPFAAPLVPDELTLDVAVSRFDLAAAAQVALSVLDLPADATPPEGFDMQMFTALMPEGLVDITLAPGSTSNAAYTLTYEGAMSAGMMGMPTGSGKITLTGIDAIMSALNSAPPEMTGSIVPVLGMAQAMGQPGAKGELIWEIDATTPGSLKVNGMDMMGGQ